MATLIINSTAGTANTRATPGLRDWLAGHWAVLFSNPEHFAPHATTPAGFITLLAQDFATCGVKPIKIGTCAETAASWLDYAGTDRANVIIDRDSDDQIVDLLERTLALTIDRLDKPFVIVLDALGRCRSTMTYQPRHGERRRTIEDMLSVVQVLKAGTRSKPWPDNERLAG